MSQSIPNCAQKAHQQTRIPRQSCRATHKRKMGILTVQTMRRFPTLEQASVYLSYHAQRRKTERFAIQQIAPNVWAMCRVIAGGAA